MPVKVTVVYDGKDGEKELSVKSDEGREFTMDAAIELVPSDADLLDKNAEVVR